MNRRGLLRGLGAAALFLPTAPAIVRAESLMKLSPPRLLTLEEYSRRILQPLTQLDVLYGYLWVHPQWNEFFPSVSTYQSPAHGAPMPTVGQAPDPDRYDRIERRRLLDKRDELQRGERPARQEVLPTTPGGWAARAIQRTERSQ